MRSSTNLHTHVPPQYRFLSQHTTPDFSRTNLSHMVWCKAFDNIRLCLGPRQCWPPSIGTLRFGTSARHLCFVHIPIPCPGLQLASSTAIHKAQDPTLDLSLNLQFSSFVHLHCSFISCRSFVLVVLLVRVLSWPLRLPPAWLSRFNHVIVSWLGAKLCGIT